jgi:uncharacterized membrane protein
VGTGADVMSGGLTMRIRLVETAERIRQSLWFLPALALAAAVLLQQILLRVDEALADEPGRWFVFGGGADSARSLLSTAAMSTLTMTTLVFSVTMLVLQLAASQLSPRLMSTFLGDRRNQAVLALFIATFAYTLLALRSVRDDFVPGLTIWAGFLIVFASIGAFVYFINHIAQSIRASSVIDRVARDTLAAIDRLYPEGLGEPLEVEDAAVSLSPEPPSREIVWRRRSATVTGVDEDALLSMGEEHACTIELVPRVGDFLPRESVVARVWGDASNLDDDAMRKVLATDVERTMQQDAAFGFRQLVDIAERALSSSTNDPTTAVQVLDQLHDLLAVLATRRFPSPYRLSDDGRLLLVLPRPGWDDYVRYALDEIQQYGMESPQIQCRLDRLLEDLLSRVPDSRRGALLRQRRTAKLRA